MSTFPSRKAQILSLLSEPDSTYTDASPKGSIDAPIRLLISEINGFAPFVTTSSCSGRVSVFVEGSGKGGKGHGGRWLFVSHVPLDLATGSKVEGMNEVVEKSDRGAVVGTVGTDELRLHTILGLNPITADPGSIEDDTRYIHLKFEPLILHVHCASPSAANTLLQVAQQAGFRESGAMNVPSSASTPLAARSSKMEVNGNLDERDTRPRGETVVGHNDELPDDGRVNVAIRTTGLSLDSIIGFVSSSTKSQASSAPTGHTGETFQSLVTEEHLRTLLRISNARFKTNYERMGRLRKGLAASFGRGEVGGRRKPKVEGWEDKKLRTERMRREGLERQERVKQEVEASKGRRDGVGREEVDEMGLAILDEG